MVPEGQRHVHGTSPRLAVYMLSARARHGLRSICRRKAQRRFARLRHLPNANAAGPPSVPRGTARSHTSRGVQAGVKVGKRRSNYASNAGPTKAGARPPTAVPTGQPPSRPPHRRARDRSGDPESTGWVIPVSSESLHPESSKNFSGRRKLFHEILPSLSSPRSVTHLHYSHPQRSLLYPRVWTTFH